MNLWVWSRSVDFRLGFSLQGFCVLYFILLESLTKDVLECIVNPAYLIGCCECTLVSLVLQTILLIQYNPQDGMLRILLLIRVIIHDAWNRNPLTIHFSVHGRYYMTRLFVEREICTYNNFCFIICFYFFILFLRLCFLIFTLYDFCVLINHSERFSILSRYELVLLELFLFYLNVFIILSDYQFRFSLW